MARIREIWFKIFQRSLDLPKITGSPKDHWIFQGSLGLPKIIGSSKDHLIFQRSLDLPKIIGSSKVVQNFANFDQSDGFPTNRALLKEKTRILLLKTALGNDGQNSSDLVQNFPKIAGSSKDHWIFQRSLDLPKIISSVKISQSLTSLTTSRQIVPFSQKRQGSFF